MLAERRRDSAERIPDTLQALIAARIDRLPAADRVLLQRAAAMGRIFMAGALRRSRPTSTASTRPSTTCSCATCSSASRARRSAASRRSSSSHVLIREVAYAGLSKASRAELHRGFAGWLKERAGDEIVEIRAFHLDQAARLLAELDGAAPPELNEEAAAALTHAGRRALSREAFRSARKLLLRAAELGPTLDRRYLAGRAAWRLGDMTAVIVEMEEVASVAASHGERRLQGRALTALAEAVLNQRADAITARELAEQAIDVLADEPPDIRFEAVQGRSHGGGVARRRRGVRALVEARARGLADRRAARPGGGDHVRARARISAAPRAGRGRAAHRPRRRARRGERQRPRPRPGLARVAGGSSSGASTCSRRRLPSSPRANLYRGDRPHGRARRTPR